MTTASRFRRTEGCSRPGLGAFGSIALDGEGLPVSVSGDEDAIYHFVNDGKIVTVREMRALGYELPSPSSKSSEPSVSVLLGLSGNSRVTRRLDPASPGRVSETQRWRPVFRRRDFSM